MRETMKWIPRRWRIFAVALLVLLHALPLLFTLKFWVPNELDVLQQVAVHPQLSFVQANSVLSVEKMESQSVISPPYKVKLDSISRTNQSAAYRQDVTLLFQDGLLIESSHQKKQNVNTLKQHMETIHTYNHLYQAISFHYAATKNQLYKQTMSHDYLYVSATKYGGIQSFHQPETVQHQNWKEWIDRGIHQQLNYEWNEAFHEFQIEPNDYFMFPLSQLPIYNQQEELPGITPDQASMVIAEIWKILFTHFMDQKEGKATGNSLPLILIDKKGDHFRVIFRTADGHYHEFQQSIPDELK